MTIKIGIIGLSDGNGHPYSWSAIFNGYDIEAMESCGYPVIPRYLEQQEWPQSCIPDAEVVAVWTQDSKLSKKIAKAAFIPIVLSNIEEMIEHVDAVLLARDDAENHLQFASAFLKAGLPVYIDKPIALNAQDLGSLYSLEQYPGQIFTCSALRYSRELMLTDRDREEIGDIRTIIATTPKSWEKYAVHIIEPVLNILSSEDNPVEFYRASIPANAITTKSLIVNWESGIQTAFFATGDGVSPLSLRVIGTKGFKELVFSDSFPAFKMALEQFVGGIRSKTIRSPKKYNELVVKILEHGGL